MKTATSPPTPIVVREWRADALVSGRSVELTRHQMRALRLLAAAAPGFYAPSEDDDAQFRHTIHRLRRRGFPGVVSRRGYGYRLDAPIEFEERPGG